MIIVRLKGGLGNQLFQYAIARCLSIELGTEFKLDISSYENDIFSRKYSLKYFNIRENFATRIEIKRYTKLERERRYLMKHIPTSLYVFLNKLLIGTPLYYYEKKFGFNEKIFNLPRNVYLDGYWQTEKYFVNFKEIIRKEFSLKERLDKNLALFDEIKSSDSISMHIRIVDKILSPIGAANNAISNFPLNYYKKCIENISKHVKNPIFFIFSNDVELVKKIFTSKYPLRYVDHNAGKDHLDLFLMSQCKHNIITNSTFSWWGAWLNPNPNKQIFAPEIWFKKSDIDSSDLLPRSWLRVSNK